MFNVIIGSFIGATICSLMMTGVKMIIIHSYLKNIEEIVAEFRDIPYTNED